MESIQEGAYVMAMLEVPDFQSVEDFQTWAKAQEPASIHRWRTRDWLKVYEKMDVLALKDPAIVKQAKDENRREREIFVERTCLELGHLYKNYCFERMQYKIIRQKAVEAGKQFAQVAEENSLDSAMLVSQLNIGKKSRHGNQQTMGAQIASIVQKTSALEEEAVGLEINDKLQSVGVQDSTENKISINSLSMGDVAIDTWFHEMAHAYLQVNTNKQDKLLKNGEISIPEFGSDFYLLMQKNSLYYLDPDYLQKRALQQNASKMSERDFFLMYSKQPVEKYSELFGLMAERSYRRESGHVSERAAMKIAEKLLLSVGRRPREAWYDDKNGRIVLRYGKIDEKSETSGQGERIQEALRCNFSSLDEKSLRRLNLHIDEGNCVQISVPTNPEEAAALMRKMDDLSFWESAEKSGLVLMNICEKMVSKAQKNLILGQERLERRFGMIAKLKEAKKKIATKLTRVEQKQSGSR
jgi:hypothetical protein